MSIGNVSINVGTDSSNYNSFVGAGDPDATAEARFTGMNILSGVYAASADQINAVNDRFDSIDDLRAVYNSAKAEVDRLLAGADADELYSGVNAAKIVLGTASVEDDPATTDADETAAATGTFIALEAARPQSTKPRTPLKRHWKRTTTLLLMLLQCTGKDDLGVPCRRPADPNADPPVEFAEATGAYEPYEEAIEAHRLAVAAAELAYTNSVAEANMPVTDAQNALDARLLALGDAQDDLEEGRKESKMPKRPSPKMGPPLAKR